MSERIGTACDETKENWDMRKISEIRLDLVAEVLV